MSYDTIIQQLMQPAVQIRCGECDIVFAVPQKWLDDRKADHQVWHCPNGHKRVFAAESETERLQRQLEWERGRSARLYAAYETAGRRAAAHKGQLTKLRRKIAKGQCPCCRQTFRDLAKHMTSEHPEYAEVDNA